MDINDIKDQYTCLICQNIYINPVKLSKCGHNMCSDCINNFSSTQKNLNCPLCRVPFTKSDIIPDQNLNNEMTIKNVKCDCGQIMPLNQYSLHSDNCAVIINKMKEEVKNKKIEINPDKVGKNRQTFDCTLCNEKNFDRVGYIDHIKNRHPNDRGVCAICKCQPWGDPNYKTHIYGHINVRHKFDYDTVVDYNDDEDQILQKVLMESMNDK